VLGKAPAISFSVTTDTTYAEKYLQDNPRRVEEDTKVEIPVPK